METRALRSAVYLSALLGIVVSLFALAEFLDASLRGICSVNSFFSCATVDNSGRTTTFGVPDYLWGVGGFVVIFVVAALGERRPTDRRLADGLVLVTTLGVALSVYFLYVELALIHALCLVCAAAYLLGAVGWIAAIGLARHVRRPPPDDPDDDADDGSADA